MNRMTIQSLLISSAFALPLLAAPVWAAPENTAITEPSTASAPINAGEGVDTIPAEMMLPEEAAEPAARRYTASLQDATRDRAVRQLDWRHPQAELRFDLSHADIIEALSVTLSADPLPNVDPSIPVVVQFNGGKPVEIPTNGRGFDSVIDLDRTRVRETGNVLRVSYAARCDAPSGGYRLNLDESDLSVTARPRMRRLQLREVETRFASLTFAPETIGLLAGGAQQTKLQSLAAQGVGLRMETIPDFRLSAGESDFDLIMVTRDQLDGYTQDATILSATGPAITLSSSEPNRLFLTGDTPDEVMASVSAFASAFLPNSRRSETTPQEVMAQNPLDVDRRLIVDTANLDMLSVQTGSHREYTFDVADPAASEGNLVLRLNRDDQTQRGTRLTATLNGVDLGAARVRGKRKTVSYPIKQGLLLGSSNRLELTTQDANNTPRCGASEPFIAIAPGSELRLSAPFPTPPSDLSRFAANGSLFSESAGADTVLVLPTEDRDFTTSLGVVAKLAQASGHGWTAATFARGETELDHRHLLMIEPYKQIERALRLSAPRGLQSAWHGHNIGGGTSEAVAQFASLDGEEVIRQAAANIRATSMIQSGGVAAIYPNETGQLIGVISNTVGSSFYAAMQPLESDMHWNGLKGAVTRWNDSAVIMAQAALPMPELGMTEVAVKPMSLTERAKSVAADLANADWPRPNIDGLGGWIDASWTNFSEGFQAKANTIQLASAKEAAQQMVAESIGAGQSMLESDHVSALKTAARGGTDSKLAAIQAKAADLRTAFWNHLDIPDQSIKSARLGQAQMIPLALGVAVLFLMILVGLAFAAPPSGPRKHDPSRQKPNWDTRRRIAYQPELWTEERLNAARNRRR